MQFRSEFNPPKFNKQININDTVMLIGSCFTDQIGNKISTHKIRTLQNPNGILFNPISISNAIETYLLNRKFNTDDLFFRNELYGSWLHHTSFSGLDKHQVLNKINTAISGANNFLKKADWLIITLGSSFVYEKLTEANDEYCGVVANCHKVPADKFVRRLINSGEIKNVLQKLCTRLHEFNKNLKIIFTISPVRHLRDGFVENNRSKANLIDAVHSVVDSSCIFYFPSYELIIDDLRDYRFYAEDLVHPNYFATQYVWEKFIKSCLDKNTQDLLIEINDINAAMLHKPFNPQSQAHKKFLKKYAEKTMAIQERFPSLDFENELKYFSLPG